jgi:hypothetical protein
MASGIGRSLLEDYRDGEEDGQAACAVIPLDTIEMLPLHGRGAFKKGILQEDR